MTENIEMLLDQLEGDGLVASDDDKRRPSQSSELVRLAMSAYNFHSTTAGEPFAVPKQGPFVARMLRGGRDSLRAELADAFDESHGRPPSAQASADAMQVLEGRARRGQSIDPALRVARSGNDLVLDIGDPTGRVVVIRASGWDVVDKSPVLFRRTALTGELPIPERGGDLSKVRALLNISSEHFDLVIGVIVAVLEPDIPHPVVVIVGEQGTGKSTAARVISSFIDPSPAQLRTCPRDIEQFAVVVSASCVVALDNVSNLPHWLSDAICRASTGDAMVRRRLYTDNDLSVLAYRRAVVLNGIDLGALRGDLAERVARIELDRIAESDRKQDADVLDSWNRLHPRALGALLDLASGVLRVLPDVHIERLPRMADFAKVLAAVDQVRGTSSLATYRGMAGSIAEDVVEDDPVASAIRRFIYQRKSWTGTAAALLDGIHMPEPRPKDWPGTGQAMASLLKRTAPAFRSVGLEVHYNEDQRPRTWTLKADDRGEAKTADAADELTECAPEQGKRDVSRRVSSPGSESLADATMSAEGHSRQLEMAADATADIAVSRGNVTPVSSVSSEPPTSNYGRSEDDLPGNVDAIALVKTTLSAEVMMETTGRCAVCGEASVGLRPFYGLGSSCEDCAGRHGQEATAGGDVECPGQTAHQ